MGEIMYDNFNTIGLQIVNPVILSIYSTCKFNGIYCM